LRRALDRLLGDDVAAEADGEDAAAFDHAFELAPDDAAEEEDAGDLEAARGGAGAARR
jgi:hypothetical protein